MVRTLTMKEAAGQPPEFVVDSLGQARASPLLALAQRHEKARDVCRLAHAVPRDTLIYPNPRSMRPVPADFRVSRNPSHPSGRGEREGRREDSRVRAHLG